MNVANHAAMRGSFDPAIGASLAKGKSHETLRPASMISNGVKTNSSLTSNAITRDTICDFKKSHSVICDLFLSPRKSKSHRKKVRI